MRRLGAGQLTPGQRKLLSGGSALCIAFVEPLLKADFRLFEPYQPRLAVLPYAVVACAAVGDDRVLDAQLEAWRERCGGGFAMQRFDATWPPWSTPHRWPVDDPTAFLLWFGPWLCSH